MAKSELLFLNLSGKSFMSEILDPLLPCQLAEAYARLRIAIQSVLLDRTLPEGYVALFRLKRLSELPNTALTAQSLHAKDPSTKVG